ncbi:terminase gpA endonuclease subunit [Pseudoduganella violaceinigra]|uniref:terminase gpA endonuclease subunit n=1 Tax=Pseudoduganella violaceinigra TaxID=246602 RepID=UPI000487194A|nr:terminase gpA endonuclease subunit [Pseudoduganella violaceinigra]
MGSSETNQNQNHNHNQVTPQQQPTLSEDCTRGAVALSIEFRRCGVKTTPANPLLLEQQFRHASGNLLTIRAVSVDSSDGTTTDAVYAYVNGACQ